jgi:hypothetical protein
MTLINPGVLNGSKGPLLYPPEEVASRPQKWNGVPIVVYHPHRLGQPVSAAEPGILDSQGVGEVRNASSNGKLQAEGWFDVQKMQKVNPALLQRLLKNEAIELSTGLYTDNEERSGTFNGRPYTAIARNYKPDHLAILPDQTGACSIKDGCGVLVNSSGLNKKLRLLANVWSDEAREAALEARKKGNKGRSFDESTGPHNNPNNPDAEKYPHLAHLMNGQKVGSSGHDKNTATAMAKSLRKKGIFAGVLKDHKAKQGSQYLVMLPTNNWEFNMDLQNKLSLLVNADPDCIDEENECSSKEDNCDATENAWSEEARQAALEARRAKSKGDEDLGTPAIPLSEAATHSFIAPSADKVDQVREDLEKAGLKEGVHWELTGTVGTHAYGIRVRRSAGNRAMKATSAMHWSGKGEPVGPDAAEFSDKTYGSKLKKRTNNKENSSSVTLKTDSPTKLVEPATLKAAIELHDLITGAAESPLKQECLKASEKFLKKFQAHLNDSEEENEDTEVEIQNKSVTDNRHTKKEGGQHMAQEVKLSKEERKAVVDGLIVNEGCCWEESDREVLNTMNDTTLAKLHKQMELVANATVSEVLGEDSEEDVAVEEEKTKKGQSQADGKVAPVGELDPGVKGKPAMNVLNEQDRRDLAFARHYRMEQRKQHIGVITANANNKFTPKQLEMMDDGVLANMAMLAKPLENTEYYPATEAMTRPSFFGSQGAAVINANAGADEEPLVLGRIDYKELSANNGHK